MNRYYLVTDGDKFAIKRIWKWGPFRSTDYYAGYSDGHWATPFHHKPEKAKWMERKESMEIIKAREGHDSLVHRRKLALAGRP